VKTKTVCLVQNYIITVSFGLFVCLLRCIINFVIQLRQLKLVRFDNIF